MEVRPRKSGGAIAFDGDSSAFSLFGPVVPDRAMHATTIVPEGHVIQGTAEANLKFCLFAVIEQQIENIPALSFRQFIDPRGKCPVDIQRLAVGIGVAPYYRMHCRWAGNFLVVLPPAA